jgi:hypothetical protein
MAMVSLPFRTFRNQTVGVSMLERTPNTLALLSRHFQVRPERIPEWT